MIQKNLKSTPAVEHTRGSNAAAQGIVTKTADQRAHSNATFKKAAYKAKNFFQKEHHGSVLNTNAVKRANLKTHLFIPNKAQKTVCTPTTALQSNNSLQKNSQKPIETWDDFDVIPQNIYPDNLPADNVDAPLYLRNLNKGVKTGSFWFKGIHSFIYIMGELNA